METTYYVVVKYVGGKDIPLHAFSRRADAELFATVNHIPSYAIEEANTDGTNPVRKIHIVRQDSGRLMIFFITSNEAATSLLNPFIADTRDGFELWHVEVSPTGKAISVHHAYRTMTCKAYHLPEEGAQAFGAWGIRKEEYVVHCLALHQQEAVRKAEAHFRLEQLSTIGDVTIHPA